METLASKEREIERLKGAASALEEKHAKELSRAEEKHEREENYLMSLADDLRAQVADYKKLTRKVIVVSAILAITIIVALIIDRSDPSVGFIWRSVAALSAPQ